MDVTSLVGILLALLASIISPVRPNEDSVDPELLERVNNMRMAEMKYQFESLDQDGDGKLSAQDYLTLHDYREDQTPEEKLWEVNWKISLDDADGDNELSLREFSGVRTKAESEAMYRRLFKDIDTDHNDLWTQNELREVYRKQGTSESLIQFILVEDFKGLDKDEDGVISIQEAIETYLEKEEETIRNRLESFGERARAQMVASTISPVRPNEDSVDPELLDRVNNMRMDEMKYQFESLDQDGDGKLSAQDYLTSHDYTYRQNDQTPEEKLWEVNWKISLDDADGDNELSLREFSGVRTKAESEAIYRRLFNDIDTNHNGFWFQNEMLEVYRKQGFPESHIQFIVAQDLKRLDKNEDGIISEQEAIEKYLEIEEETIRGRLESFGERARAQMNSNDQ